MRLSQAIHPTLALENNYLQLAKSIENCSSEEECLDILLNQNSYRLIYPKRQLNNPQYQCLYHLIRSRIAYLQRDINWFNKENKVLVGVWIQEERFFAKALNKLGKNGLCQLFSFSKKKEQFMYVFFEIEEDLLNYHKEVRDWLLNNSR